MKSGFLVRFKAQHGPRESGLLAGHSEQRLRDEVQRGKIAAAELEARQLWDEKRQSALYAWTARQPKAPIMPRGRTFELTGPARRARN